jgi:hypothetical protein
MSSSKSRIFGGCSPAPAVDLIGADLSTADLQ